jgi:hypothetical protein
VMFPRIAAAIAPAPVYDKLVAQAAHHLNDCIAAARRDPSRLQGLQGMREPARPEIRCRAQRFGAAETNAPAMVGGNESGNPDAR